MIKFSTTVDSVNSFVGRSTSWLSLVLVLVIVLDVFLRYVLNWSSPASFELEWHIFAVLFLVPAGWTLQQDRHVRVDVFYTKFSPKKQAAVNLFGSLFLLLPLCYVGVLESSTFVVNSFAVKEMSPDPGGLPARYLIKSMITLSFFLLGLQAVSVILKSIVQLSARSDA